MIKLKIGDKIKIISAGEFNDYEVGDVMIVDEVLTSKVIAIDNHDNEQALWFDDFEIIDNE